MPRFQIGKIPNGFLDHYSHRKIELENIRPHEENTVSEHRFLVSSKAHEQ